MQLSFPYLVSLRHLRAFRRHTRLSLSATVGVLGIAIGVAALIVAISVMNGYASVVKERLLGVNAHVTVRQAYSEPFGNHAALLAALEKITGVAHASPFAQAEGFVLSKQDDQPLRRSGCVARGVTRDGLEGTTILSQRIVEGTLSLDRAAPGVFHAMIGNHLADRIDAGPGDEIHLSMLPRELLLGGLPPLRRYIVSGVFSTGYYEFDSNLIFVPLEALQRDLGWGGMVSGLRLKLDDPFAVDDMGPALTDAISEHDHRLFTSSWIYEHGNLYVWIRMQTWFSGIALSLIVVVAAFNLISIMTMSVIDRREEVGILKAMGASSAHVARLFSAEGATVGLIGVGLGNVLAFMLCYMQVTFEWVRLRGDVYLINALPVEMVATDFVLVSVGAMFLCYLFTKLPARDAGAMSPAEAIRAA